jgi:hypothetical protein
VEDLIATGQRESRHRILGIQARMRGSSTIPFPVWRQILVQYAMTLKGAPRFPMFRLSAYMWISAAYGANKK